MQAIIAYPAPSGIDGQHAARLVLGEMLNIRMGAVRDPFGYKWNLAVQVKEMTDEEVQKAAKEFFGKAA